PRLAAVFVALALAGLTFHSFLDEIPLWGFVTDFLTVVVIGGLGIWAMERGRVEARLAAENEALAAERLREVKRTRVLAEAGQVFSSSLELQRVLQAVVEKATAEELGDFGVLFMLDEADGSLRLEAMQARDPDFRERAVRYLTRVPLDVGVASVVVRTGKPVMISEVSRAELTPKMRILLDALNTISIVSVPVLVKNKVIGVLTIGITHGERRFEQEDLLLAQELATLAAASIDNARLYAAQESLIEQLNEAKREREQFLGMITHEISGILTVLSGYAQLLSRPEKRRPELIDKAAPTILEQSKRLSRLVTDLQDVSRIERGKFEVYKSECDLVSLARRVLEEQQLLSGDHKLVLESAVDSLPGNWDCDRLSEAVSNLVRNAVNYSPEGREVKVAITPRDSHAQLAVTDRGIGISAEDLGRLFRPYSRLDRTKQVKGTGLGLFITKAIVEAHDGSIAVESEPGKGSTFVIMLPRQEGNGKDGD
ncbi:MAG: HAMP domain-containing histidine kinase, partial [Chloroflexi bacterium]|nr:HAMP domain-containing histidine kinase [Chloroflexota bacterium]